MEMENQKKSTIKVVSDLRSGDSKTVLAAIKKIEQLADEVFVLPLLEFYRDTDDENAKETVKEMLSTLNVSGGEDALVSALGSLDFAGIQGDILFFIWHSGFQPVDHIHLVCKIAVDGDFMTAFEALTLIESLGGPVNDDSLMEGLMIVRGFLADNKEHPHRELIFNIFQVLTTFENQG